MSQSMKTPTHLIWFRQDLRLFENTALTHCCQNAFDNNAGVLAVVYITPQQWQSHHKSLWQVDLMVRQIHFLRDTLAKINIGLVVRITDNFDSQVIDLMSFCQKNTITHIFANKEYLVNEINRDKHLSYLADNIGISTHFYDDSTIVAPSQIVTDSGTPYKVFTPFYKRWLDFLDKNPVVLNDTITPSLIDTTHLSTVFDNTDLDLKNLDLNNINQDNIYLKDFDLNTLDFNSLTIDTIYQNFYQNFYQNSNNEFTQKTLAKVKNLGSILYPADELYAQKRLNEFIQNDIMHYDTNRDVPSLNDSLGATSRLSPYLAIGMISPRLCYLKALNKLTQNQNHKDIYRFISELCWRDFYADVAFVRPDIVKGGAFLSDLDKRVPWRYDAADFMAWQTGKTGVPIVDASMRCLNATGFLHNRLRMVVAMYLTKNLLIDWRWGERYFMSRLVDGDFASNNGGWQWSASIGTDAQPYFRVMNPFNQADTHDKDAVFIKKWVPELKNVPANIINNETKLQKYLAQNPSIHYPKLLVPTKQSRAVAIEIFQNAK